MFKLIASGIVGRDPETSTYGDGKTLTRFSLAVKKRTGNGAETVWLSVTAFGKLGELCAKYLHKKSRAMVIGVPSAKVYTSKTEEVVASLDVIADDVEFLDPGQGGPEESSQSGYGAVPGGQSGAAAPAFTPVHDSEMPF